MKNNTFLAVFIQRLQIIPFPYKGAPGAVAVGMATLFLAVLTGY